MVSLFSSKVATTYAVCCANNKKESWFIFARSIVTCFYCNDRLIHTPPGCHSLNKKKKEIKRTQGYSLFLFGLKDMLRRSILRRHQPLINLHRQTYAYYHATNSVYSQPKQAEEESPLNKLSQGISAFASTLLNAPPLRRVTKPNIETLPFTGNATSWEQAIREAQSLVNSADQERIFDPVKVVGKDLWELKGNITKLLGSGHPFIDTIGKHYFESDTNRIRPLLVLLIAKASSVADKDPSRVVPDGPISDTQRRLAEITEMIYTASLLHYDVIDNNEASNAVFGNKMAVLAGDFLLARSSVALAQLKNAECIELMATCIAHLVEGEFMQLQKPKEDMDKNKAFEYYLKQVYMKTSSLIAESCKASSVLAGCTSHVVKAAYDYGNNFGIAFQVILATSLYDDLWCTNIILVTQ